MGATGLVASGRDGVPAGVESRVGAMIDVTIGVSITLVTASVAGTAPAPALVAVEDATGERVSDALPACG